MKKGVLIALAVVLILGIGIGTYCFLNKDNSPSNKIPEGYIAVFNGGTGEIMYKTYVYKLNNGQNDYGFRYINVESRTASWGSSNWIDGITKIAKVDHTDNVLEVAKDNNAYSFVMFPGDTEAHKVDEFVKKF